MYNRYIPQPDGSYRRSAVQDPQRQPQPQKTEAVPQNPAPSPVSEEPPNRPVRKPACKQNPRPRPLPPPSPKQDREEPGASGIGAFLRHLLPRDFDTADLIVVLLLLLISADSSDDPNNALLTLALYLFM